MSFETHAIINNDNRKLFGENENAPSDFGRISLANPSLHIQWLPHGKGLPLPAYKHPGDAGLDLCAATPPGRSMYVDIQSQSVVPCGFNIAVPEGYVGLVCPRSGLAMRGITLANSPGVLDSQFRGEIQLLVTNHGSNLFSYQRGDRLAQLLIVPVARVEVVAVETLDETARGEGGFGSTGR